MNKPNAPYSVVFGATVYEAISTVPRDEHVHLGGIIQNYVFIYRMVLARILT